ncbi:anti-sigma factor antagonist [Acrocarpospora pleiomorpha]|uniref:Anti-sigma factor antagonist n=1 Tax=Acrocarpospora pleiomorpha TaxID=90975 RepID=A0A5M3X899_9ACTN|nr:STAS domain-containing protein [Acrocarpospora pleiomorpha]GES17905.1 anti-sigma factor antagonist [Acrocarpospora pleiomorpha]
MANLTMRSTAAEGIVVIHIDGILDATTRDQFSEYLDTEAEEHGPGMVLDLGGVSFLDSRALGLIVHHWQRSTGAGGHFALIAVHYPTSKVMWVTGLSQRLPMFETLDEALAAFAN